MCVGVHVIKINEEYSVNFKKIKKRYKAGA